MMNPTVDVDLEAVTRIWSPVDAIEIEIEIDEDPGQAGAAAAPAARSTRSRTEGADYVEPAWVVGHAAIGPTLLGFTIDPGHCELSDDELAEVIGPAPEPIARGSSASLLPVPPPGPSLGDVYQAPATAELVRVARPAPRPSSSWSTAAVLLAASASLGVMLALWTEVGFPLRRRAAGAPAPARAVVVDVRPTTPAPALVGEAAACEVTPVAAPAPTRRRGRTTLDVGSRSDDALFARRR